MSWLDRQIARVAPGYALNRLQNSMRFSALDSINASGSVLTDVPETRNRGASLMMRSLHRWFPRIGSGVSDLPTNERRTLTARSRDAYRGHMIARAAITRARTNVVGTGLIPHAAVDAEALGITEDEADTLNRQIDREFALYAENPRECDAGSTLDFYGTTSLAFVSSLLSGDVFGTTPFSERPGCIYGTKMQLVESDRISNPNDGCNTDRLIDGVEIDELGAPINYCIRNTHPGDLQTNTITRWDKVPVFGAETGRRRVLHLFNEIERPGQMRGAPFLGPILEALQKGEQWSRSELTAAVTSSLFTVFLEQQAAGQLDSDGNPVPLIEGTDSRGNIEMGPGAIVGLEPGTKASFANPSRPNAQFDPFFMSLMRQIGAALEIPVDELMLSYQASYSAARAAMLQAFRFYSQRRWGVVQQFCVPWRALWFDEAVARGRLAVTGYADPVRRAAYLAAIWVGPARGAMDEDKEAAAAKARVELGISNLKIETAAIMGEDSRSVGAQRRREIEAARKANALSSDEYGISVRAGLVTPCLADETAFRDSAGLPPPSEEVIKAWTEDGGVRRPITLQAEVPPPSQPNANDPNNPA